MVQLGYALSSEEHTPRDLVRWAQRAEEVGFPFALISDHFHPWVDAQGHSPLVWSVLGGIAMCTDRLQIGTGVTAPIMRTHPVIIAQAAATIAAMMPGRFFLGVGTGENLNEHILGEHWPPFDLRAEMLDEAVEVMRLMWEGGDQSFYGSYYTVENARLYTLPEEPIPVMVAAAGKKAAELAGEIGDGLINTSPDREVVEIFEQAGMGEARPKYAQMTVCCGADEAQARKTAHQIWPIAGMKGELLQELPTPAHFEQAVQMVREEDVAESVICGSDPQKHLAMIQQYIDAGYDHIYVHQVGADQEAFFSLYQQHILPKFQ
ncbi:MAG: TIGR03557 family F420-dependent LLM class oxidoreductase [bacterium]|nr:TIGR03557 family F420-dependent LLM class oxidoreductase [bacterium]